MYTIFQFLVIFPLFHLSQQEIMVDSEVRNSGDFSKHLSNCSRYSVQESISCACLEFLDRQCVLCCTFEHERCCFPYKCSTCLEDAWGYMTLMQISISVAIFVAVGFAIVMLFKACNKYAILRATQARNDPLRCPCSGPCCCSCTNQNRVRPPRYNEIYEAPPVYNSSSIRPTTSFEPPPTYSSRIIEFSRTVNLESAFTSHAIRQNEIIPTTNHM